MKCLVRSRLPTKNGTFDMYYYEHGAGDSKKELLVLGNGKFQSKSLNSHSFGGNKHPIDHYHTIDHTTDHTIDHTIGHTIGHTTDHTIGHTTDHTVDQVADHTIDQAADHATDVCPAQKIFVRIHSSCITSEVFSSNRCDCAQQLQESF